MEESSSYKWLVEKACEDQPDEDIRESLSSIARKLASMINNLGEAIDSLEVGIDSDDSSKKDSEDDA